jgi:thioredoxin reductase
VHPGGTGEAAFADSDIVSGFEFGYPEVESIPEIGVEIDQAVKPVAGTFGAEKRAGGIPGEPAAFEQGQDVGHMVEVEMGEDDSIHCKRVIAAFGEAGENPCPAVEEKQAFVTGFDNEARLHPAGLRNARPCPEKTDLHVLFLMCMPGMSRKRRL